MGTRTVPRRTEQGRAAVRHGPQAPPRDLGLRRGRAHPGGCGPRLAWNGPKDPGDWRPVTRAFRDGTPRPGMPPMPHWAGGDRNAPPAWWWPPPTRPPCRTRPPGTWPRTFPPRRPAPGCQCSSTGWPGRDHPDLRHPHWIEQSYKQVKDELGWADFQVRSDTAIRRHQALVNCAFCFCWVRRGSGSVVIWRRAQMVLLSAQGMDVAAIAKVAFTSEDRVRDVIRNFNADGFDSLYPKYRGGRAPKFTLGQRRAIKKIAKSRARRPWPAVFHLEPGQAGGLPGRRGSGRRHLPRGPARAAARGRRHLPAVKDLEGLQRPALPGEEGPHRAPVRHR